MNNDQLGDLKKLPDTLTNEEWQDYFEELRSSTIQTSKNLAELNDEYDYQKGHLIYNGVSLPEEYCTFINDILDTIRSGKKDYCFTIDHICDLLKFEKDNLSATWLPNYGCFELALTNRNKKSSNTIQGE